MSGEKQMAAHLEEEKRKMIRNIVEKIDGYHGEYVDRFGKACKVKGTYALGVPMSWHDDKGNWLEICGHNQGRDVETLIEVRQTPL